MNLNNQMLLEVYRRLIELETVIRTLRLNTRCYEKYTFEPFVKINPKSMVTAEKSLKECRKKISQVMTNME